MKGNFEEKIKLLVEERIIEATKKQISNKVISISKNLGKPIIAHSVLGNKLDDPWRLEEDIIYDPTNIVIQNPDEFNTREMGFHFDGLRCGINLCITTLIYDNKVSELKVTYNGYLVFVEVEGDLKVYAPFPLWENAVDMFYEGAIQLEKKRASKDREEKKEEGKKRMNDFWKKFKMLWGY